MLTQEEAVRYLSGCRLSDQERLVAYCRLTTECTDRETAGMIGTSPDVVRTALSNARKKLFERDEQDRLSETVAHPPAWALAEARELMSALSPQPSSPRNPMAGPQPEGGIPARMGDRITGKRLTDHDVAQMIYESEQRRAMLPGRLIRWCGDDLEELGVDTEGGYALTL